MKIGIDLGTTNSALAWIDPREAEDLNFPPIHIFEVPQFVAPGKTEPRRTLPSFMFLEDGRPIGVYAREQGAIVPTRLVHSAKSWLSNPEVDRTAKILPWDSQETGRVLSPVEVSSEFLRRFRDAWDKQHETPLADEDIVLTVPASFDEEARELTVMAAAEAGLPKLTLLEEPAAAFYSWIVNNFERSRRLLHDGQICWCATWEAAPATSVSFASAVRATASTLPARPSENTCCWEAIISISHLPGWWKRNWECLFQFASAAVCDASVPRRKSGCSAMRI